MICRKEQGTIQSILLIHPPLVKPGEPPAGLAKLAGALQRHNVPFTLVDTNIEGLLSLLNRRTAAGNSDDIWTRRSRRHFATHLDFLRSPDGYRNMDRYKRAVLDINRLLTKSLPAEHALRLSLSDYEDHRRSPLISQDLMAAAEAPEENPFYAYFRERFPILLNQSRPSWVGFSLNYLSQALCCFAMIGYLREIDPDIKIVLGGGLVTSWMQRPDWRNPFLGLVDEWVAGPGEGPLLSLLDVVHDGQADTPDYSAFPLAHYLSPEFILPYSASSGCYWRRCAFCPEKAEANPYQPSPDDHVISTLVQWAHPQTGTALITSENIGGQTASQNAIDTSIARQHLLVHGKKPILIHLLDNAIRPSLLRQMATRPPGAPWYGFARISKELTEPDFCRALKNAGCVMLKLGVESGSQRVLDALDKGIELETTVKVLKALHWAGIAAYVYLLFGTPPEKERDAIQTLDFVVRHCEWIDFLNVAIFNLPAWSQDAKNLETGAFYEGDLSLYRTFAHPAGWDRPIVRQFLSRAFKRHPAVAGILRHDPPFFTSNHAPLFALFQSRGKEKTKAAYTNIPKAKNR